MSEAGPRVRRSSSTKGRVTSEAEGNVENGTPEPTYAQRGPVPVGRSLEIATTEELCMELLVDKLKLLNYEREFCRKKKPHKKPLSASYFAFPSATGSQSEQFFYFTSLVAWIFQSVGVDFPAPKEFDEPIAICSNIVATAKRLGFASPSYSPTILRNGFGKEVCGLLDALVDYCLESRNFSFRRPVYQTETSEEDAEIDDDAEVLAADVGNEVAGVAAEEEEEAYMPSSRSAMSASTSAAAHTEKAAQASKVDPALWRLEVERVAPRLKITIGPEAKDWRSHLDTAHHQRDQITTAWPQAKQHLERMQVDITGGLDKLQTREKYLNEQFEQLMRQYRFIREQLLGVQVQYNKRAESVSERNNELHRIQEQLDEVKRVMDERGSNISDTSPVVRIKAAIKKVVEEMRAMEVRIGVVSHTLLRLSLRDRNRLHASLSEELLDG